MNQPAENIKPIREGFVDTSKTSGEAEKMSQRAAPPPHLEEPPMESPAETKEVWPIIVKLMHKKIANNEGELVDRLSFRQPRGGDINRYGNPCRVNQEGDVVIDERKMHYIMAALSGILPPMLETMDPEVEFRPRFQVMLGGEAMVYG